MKYVYFAFVLIQMMKSSQRVHEFQNILVLYLEVLKGALCSFGEEMFIRRGKKSLMVLTELTDSLFYFGSYLQDPSLPLRQLQTLFQGTYSPLRTSCFMGVIYTGDHGDISPLLF